MSLKKEDFSVEIDFKKVKEKLGEKRYEHSLFVLKAASRLAEQLNLNQKKVKTAALLHDIAKSKDKTELDNILKDSRWNIDEIEASIVPIIHAPAGAVVAETEFGIKDQDILNAIRFHTLGHPEMGSIAQVVYAADFISEDRDFSGLNEIREEIERDFESGLYLILTSNIKHQLNQDNFIHPYSNDLRNKLLKRSDR